ncbi:MAG TPA: OmpA family protein [Vicinamibacterales bacterium]|nr:OmpA family protein [Vicinamibacterales bacterium]
MLDRVTKALAVMMLCGTTVAWAQTPPAEPLQQPDAAQQPPATTTTTTTIDSDADTRPATTTFRGDTGLWFVPTGEVLPARRWSFSLYRANVDFEQGFTDVSTWPITFAVGLADRAELFAAVHGVVRIDRDVRPIFLVGAEGGGLVNSYPNVTSGWTGNQFGDVYVGGKVNLLSQHRNNGAAVALRGMVKLPTAEDEVGTGKADFHLGAIASRELNERVELAGFAEVVLRGDPDDIDLSHGLAWGVGAGFPTRRSLRFTAELHGEALFDDTVSAPVGLLRGVDGSLSPAGSPQRSPIHASFGLTWQGANGMFVGGGLNANLRHRGRSDIASTLGVDDNTGDALGFQVRVGYHPGVRAYAPPAPPPPPPAAPVNAPPTVKARCEPCTVEVGRSATLTADAQDPDGDQLTYRWSAPAGTLQTPADRQTAWTAPMEPGPVPATVTVDDGRGGTASDTVTLQVIRPPVKEFVFEDVHFDFDRYTLRPEATRILDEAITALGANAELRLEIEGHTCNIGTAEYNLALGERRATAVREYLASRGVSADRLRTVSYGEERPKHDNAREETRRLNRRAAMVVRVQQ